MSDVEARLATAKERVEKAKSARIRAEAQLEQLAARREEILETLRSHGVSDMESAQQLTETLQSELETLLDEIEEKL